VSGSPQDWGAGGRFKLAQVWRQDGAETWVLVHVEVQSQADATFAERMYVYNYRLRESPALAVTAVWVAVADHSGGLVSWCSALACRGGLSCPVRSCYNHAA